MMRLLMILMLAVAVAGALADASPAEVGKVEMGLLAGWSRSDWDYVIPEVDEDRYEGKNGFQAGFFAALPLSAAVGLRAEALYVRKGGKMTGTIRDDYNNLLGDFAVFSNVDYVQIPVLLTAFLGTGENIRPRILAGPYLALETNADLSVDDGGFPELQEEMGGDLEGTQGTDFGFVLGGGFEWCSGDRPVLLEVRYDLGLVKHTFDAKNEAWTVMAGVGF